MGFKGGKGVATFAGLLLATMWKVALAAALIWAAMAAIFRYSSLAALTAAAALPFLTRSLIGDMFAVWVTVFLMVLIYYRHMENIQRLLAGTESMIGGGKKKEDAA